MQVPTTSRRPWRLALILPALILGAALTLWLAPQASPQHKRTAPNFTSPLASQAQLRSASPPDMPGFSQSERPVKMNAIKFPRLPYHVPIQGTPGPGRLPVSWRDRGAEYWHWMAVNAERRADRLEQRLQRRWRPTVLYAIRLASVVYGVPYRDMLSVARCESGLYTYSEHPSSHASGVFQFLPSTWAGAWGAKVFADAGFSVWDPVANSLAAARMVAREGWGQWVCKPGR